uniref:Uncharacterized protein n=1 Tax=Picea glauca TaxID=3330 RepID=A0A101LY16_PICGL|nr:hypothetical protein ABT39_MTgene5628 [Picea glauca]QHR88077.1 hypothetical protein Q903MT_gene2090 [Picea sitchensis]
MTLGVLVGETSVKHMKIWKEERTDLMRTIHPCMLIHQDSQLDILDFLFWRMGVHLVALADSLPWPLFQLLLRLTPYLIGPSS